MLDTFLSASPWIVAAVALLLALFFWLEAKEWRRESAVFRVGESRLLNERDKLLKKLAQQQAAIVAAQDAMEKVTSKEETMISRETAHEIERLLASTGLSNRQIAARTGVSRTTVGSICRRVRRYGEGPTMPPKGPAVRCPDCGYKSPAPCWACQMREMRRKQHPKEE